MHKTNPHEQLKLKRQKGVVLVITLIVLVAMTLAALALMRSIDTGNVVSGNMAFKQGATLAGDAGTEAAINYLGTIVGTANSYTRNDMEGYYPFSPTPEWDMTGNSGDLTRGRVNWDIDNCGGVVPIGLCFHPSASVAGAGANTDVKYVIHRLCQTAGDPNGLGNNCATTSSEVTGVSMGAKDYTSKGGMKGMVQVEYYRITTRVKGPRNTISYIETIVHF